MCGFFWGGFISCIYKLMIGVFFIFGVECSLYKLMIGVFVTFLWGNFHETDEVLEKNVGNFHSSPNEDTNMKTLESQPKG